MARLMQPSFAGGELSPTLHARVDLVKYKTGAKLLRNFVIHPHGGVSNRSGLQFVAECKHHDKVSRLVPFIASSDDAYVLEIGHQYMRVFREGSRVIVPGPNTTFELALPYLEADLPWLKFAQSNDILTITHEDYQPRELARYDHHLWTPSVINFQPGSTTPGAVTLSITNGYTGTDYVATNYSYAITGINANGDESLQGASATGVSDLRYHPKNVIHVNWSAVSGAVRYNVYKYDNGLWGLIGTTTTNTFEDKNYKADVTNGPPQGNNPFNGVGKYPRTASFYQQRRMFASTVNQPQTVFGTQSGNYYNMSVSIPTKANDALEFTIASQQLQKIHHLVALGDLLVFTKSGEWKVTGAADEVLSPTSIMARPQSNYGSAEHLMPLVIGNQIVFVQDKGDRVRDIGYEFSKDGYTGNDLTILADHLFKGVHIVEWAYQQAPFSCIWCVMSDGTLRTLTYMREHEVWGWARHDTNGFVESVAVVPEGEEDTPYFIVRRYINGGYKRYIEKLHRHYFEERSDAFYVDSGLTYDDPIGMVSLAMGPSTAWATLQPGHGLVVGDEVEVKTITEGPYKATFEGDYVIAEVLGDDVSLETPDGENVDITGIDYALATIVVRKKVQTLAGLGHLEGEPIIGLADGGVVGDDPNNPIIVSGGQVTLPYKAGRIHLGLQYASEFESLEMQVGEQVVIGNYKNVGQVRVRVESTAGILVGPSVDLLQEYRPRATEDYDEMAKLVTGDIEVNPPPTWTYHGRVCVRQELPLPVTMLGLIPDIDYGE